MTVTAGRHKYKEVKGEAACAEQLRNIDVLIVDMEASFTFAAAMLAKHYASLLATIAASTEEQVNLALRAGETLAVEKIINNLRLIQQAHAAISGKKVPLILVDGAFQQFWITVVKLTRGRLEKEGVLHRAVRELFRGEKRHANFYKMLSNGFVELTKEGAAVYWQAPAEADEEIGAIAHTLLTSGKRVGVISTDIDMVVLLELRHVLLLLYTLIGLQGLTFPKVVLFLALTGSTDYSRKPAAGTHLRLTKRIIDLLKDKRVPDKEGSTVSSVLAAITPALAAIDEEVRAVYMALEPTNGNNRGEAMRRTAHALNGQASMLGAALDYINGTAGMPVSTPEHRTSLVCAVLALSGEALMEVDGDDVTSALERVAEINGLSTRLTWTYGQAMHIAFKFDADAVYRKDFGEKERELVPSRFNPAVCEGETFIIATFDIETCTFAAVTYDSSADVCAARRDSAANASLGGFTAGAPGLAHAQLLEAQLKPYGVSLVSAHIHMWEALLPSSLQTTSGGATNRKVIFGIAGKKFRGHLLPSDTEPGDLLAALQQARPDVYVDGLVAEMPASHMLLLLPQDPATGNSVRYTGETLGAALDRAAYLPLDRMDLGEDDGGNAAAAEPPAAALQQQPLMVQLGGFTAGASGLAHAQLLEAQLQPYGVSLGSAHIRMWENLLPSSLQTTSQGATKRNAIFGIAGKKFRGHLLPSDTEPGDLLAALQHARPDVYVDGLVAEMPASHMLLLLPLDPATGNSLGGFTAGASGLAHAQLLEAQLQPYGVSLGSAHIRMWEALLPSSLQTTSQGATNRNAIFGIAGKKFRGHLLPSDTEPGDLLAALQHARPDVYVDGLAKVGTVNVPVHLILTVRQGDGGQPEVIHGTVTLKELGTVTASDWAQIRAMIASTVPYFGANLQQPPRAISRSIKKWPDAWSKNPDNSGESADWTPHQNKKKKTTKKKGIGARGLAPQVLYLNGAYLAEPNDEPLIAARIEKVVATLGEGLAGHVVDDEVTNVTTAAAWAQNGFQTFGLESRKWFGLIRGEPRQTDLAYLHSLRMGEGPMLNVSIAMNVHGALKPVTDPTCTLHLYAPTSAE
eukprot:gene7893-27073_t